ncbi:SOS response-associated peptidase [Xanthobacter oligotrophicus]|uniref:SOS response-associated peptidase n=1 Tax=Xanthobacter oligotrophicus TaxID=2607286 RepID=UPI0011F15E05|nr:SOS response-associated peptidase [Xanthobacter oligotrophicus]MCG5234553.1 SOS response-associated peptidase [Xanthobacter oligotrophicus]
MCGRFVQQMPPVRAGELFDVDPALAALPNAPPRYNAAPTQDLMVVRRDPQTGARHLSLLKWGLVPSFAKDASGGARLINARSETASEKLSFRAAWRARRRCIVPADGFYEWARAPGRRQPFFIRRADGRPLALAGLWEGWRDPATGQWLRTFTILTTAADPKLRPLHERMPVILPEADIAAFLEAEDPRGLMRSFPGADLDLRPVSDRVNAVRNDDPELIAPLPAEAAASAVALLSAGADADTRGFGAPEIS